jgi:short-subunit dehydrogenase
MAAKGNKRPRACITGASSGIGKAFAERLARDGYDLIVVARRGDRLEALASQLRASPGVNVDVVVADLGQAADVRALEKRIESDEGLEMLVNNAGFGAHMPFTELDPRQAEELINVQVLAVTRLTRAALPGMLARGKGVVINVSSRLGFSGPVVSGRLPKSATYCATKAYINTFTQLLHNELEGTGVKVQALCPAVVLTEFHTRQGIDPKRFPPEIVSRPEEIVQASLAGLRLGEVICMPGMEDTSLLDRLEEDQRQLFDRSGASAVARRYTA